MSRLKELIQEYCPDGVEYRKLKEVCADIIVPMRDRPKKLDGPIPWCRIEDKEGQYFNKSLSGLGVSEETIKEMNLKVFPTGTVICSCSASLGAYAINTQPLITNQTFIGLVCGPEILNKYLLYFMETQTEVLRTQATTGTIPYISRKKFENLLAPVPPLPVQQEIVDILDAYTKVENELETQLQKELGQRKKQYEYYRNILMPVNVKDNAGYKQVTLPDISENLDSLRKPVTKSNREEGPYPYYGASGIVDHVNSYIFNGDYLLISEDGANLTARVTPIAFSISGKSWVNNHAHVLKFDNPYLQKYVEIYLNAIDLSKYISGGAQPKLNQQNLNNIPIILPDEQKVKKVVETLTTFDTYCTSLTSGLPSEISLRKKQYEYYRDKLLSFKRTDNR